MGQRGRAPSPVPLKLLRGETRPSRLGTGPQPTDPPTKPDDLSPEGAKVWDRILGCTDHIGQAHTEALRQYSELTATINSMHPKGSKEWRELVLVHLRLARELCLTPATGGNLGQIRKEPERKLAKYVG